MICILSVAVGDGRWRASCIVDANLARLFVRDGQQRASTAWTVDPGECARLVPKLDHVNEVEIVDVKHLDIGLCIKRGVGGTIGRAAPCNDGRQMCAVLLDRFDYGGAAEDVGS